VSHSSSSRWGCRLSVQVIGVFFSAPGVPSPVWSPIGRLVSALSLRSLFFALVITRRCLKSTIHNPRYRRVLNGWHLCPTLAFLCPPTCVDVASLLRIRAGAGSIPIMVVRTALRTLGHGGRRLSTWSNNRPFDKEASGVTSRPAATFSRGIFPLHCSSHRTPSRTGRLDPPAHTATFSCAPQRALLLDLRAAPVTWIPAPPVPPTE